MNVPDYALEAMRFDAAKRPAPGGADLVDLRGYVSARPAVDDEHELSPQEAEARASVVDDPDRSPTERNRAEKALTAAGYVRPGAPPPLRPCGGKHQRHRFDGAQTCARPGCAAVNPRAGTDTVDGIREYAHTAPSPSVGLGGALPPSGATNTAAPVSTNPSCAGTCPDGAGAAILFPPEPRQGAVPPGTPLPAAAPPPAPVVAVPPAAAGAGPPAGPEALPTAAPVEAPTTSACAAPGAPPAARALSYLEMLDTLEADFASLPEPSAVAPLAIADDVQAERIVARLLDREAQIDRLEAQAAAMVAELRRDQKGLAWRFALALEAWARDRFRGRARSVKTLAGTVGVRSVPGAPRLTDPRAAEAWALAQPDPELFGSYGYTLKPEAVLAYVKATGEVVPGVEIPAAREDLYVKSAAGAHLNLSKLRAPAALPTAPTNEEE